MTLEISIKELLDKYTQDHELLKHVLLAKSEEDKRQTAKAVLKTEQARIHLRQLDIQFAKEQRGHYKFARHEEPYPHSAHPLCRSYLQPTTPVSPIEKPDLSHHQVMAALKQKIRHTTYENRKLPKLHRLPPIDTCLKTRSFV